MRQFLLFTWKIYRKSGTVTFIYLGRTRNKFWSILSSKQFSKSFLSKSQTIKGFVRKIWTYKRLGFEILQKPIKCEILPPESNPVVYIPYAW